jgi:hypothetical protein
MVAVRCIAEIKKEFSLLFVLYSLEILITFSLMFSDRFRLKRNLQFTKQLLF